MEYRDPSLLAAKVRAASSALARGWRAFVLRLRARDPRLVAAAIAVLGAASCSVGAATAAWNRACAGGCPTAQTVVSYQPQQSSEVYDADGELLAIFSRERRRVVSIEELPPHLPLAFVAIEDQRFFRHGGVDLHRFFGSVWDNLREGFGATGFSTITMQLARDLFPRHLPRTETSIRRKVAEIRVALRMEQTLSKQRILELYLNHINLGAGAYGVEAAARTYFDKPASGLNFVEAATLAGLPQAPSRYNPRRNPGAARERRNRVLRFMADNGVITREELAWGVGQPVSLAPPRGAIQAPYFVEQVRRDLEERFGELLYTGGLKIHTALDADLQKLSEDALEEQIQAIESGRFGYFPHPVYGELSAEERAERGGRTGYLQGAVVVMDPETGLVRALVGGRNFRHSQFNRATQALRQPGSAFKPFVYAAALERGRSPMYRISDAPVFIRMENGETWAPRNYDGRYGGMVTMRQALRLSRNLPAVRMGREVGVDAVRAVARRTGIETPIPPYPSIFLGAAGVYPIDLIASFASFGNGGVRVEPRLISRVEDQDGNLLYQPPHHPVPALDPASAWILTDMLREVVDRGTAYDVRRPTTGNLPYQIPAAGKTGTTNDAADVWFIGYTPDLLAGVWMGMDRRQRIKRGATGGDLAAPVWAEIVRQVYEGKEPPQAWEKPEGVVTRRVDQYTGRAVTADCPYAFQVTMDYFVRSNAPTPACEPPERWFDPTPGLPGRPVFPDREEQRGVPWQEVLPNRRSDRKQR
ncbi:MAG: penicillin-binding protein 1A [Longimicrobiaceae bacterium]